MSVQRIQLNPSTTYWEANQFLVCPKCIFKKADDTSCVLFGKILDFIVLHSLKHWKKYVWRPTDWQTNWSSKLTVIEHCLDREARIWCKTFSTTGKFDYEKKNFWDNQDSKQKRRIYFFILWPLKHPNQREEKEEKEKNSERKK